MSNLSISTDQIIKELTLHEFITRQEELDEITKKIEEVIKTQSEKTFDRFEQIDRTFHFIETIWDKYDCKEIADIYSNFIKIEEALYGLEREESLGKRYRDHFVHMFNCYIFGIRIIAHFIKELPENKAKKIFKVENENLKEIGLPFGSNYSYKQRLFYIWTLISTFHDIAIPFQHLTGIGKGVNEFIKEFGWVFTDSEITMTNYDSSQLFHYFNLLSSLYGGSFDLIENGKKYKKTEKPHFYLAKILGREFDLRNHGVLSGFFLWKTIEEIFLIDRSKKYKLDLNQFNTYTEYVLEQDIARSALAISLHSIKEIPKTNIYPKIFPISFRSLPLTFLLILSDELQDYLRWEGISLKKEMKFSYHPILNIEIDKDSLIVNLTVCFSIDSKNKENIIKQANFLNKHLGIDKNISKLKDAIKLICKSLKINLEKKLLLGDEFKLELNVYEDWNKNIYNEKFNSS